MRKSLMPNKRKALFYIVVISAVLLAQISAVNATLIENRFVYFHGKFNRVPSPEHVESKEASDEFDINASGAPDSEQVIAWDLSADGVLEVADAFDYSGSRPFPGEGQVDALANVRDTMGHVLFQGSPVSTLLFSVRLPGGSDLPGAPILFEKTGGVIGTWVALDEDLPRNLDGLEIWGPISPNNLDNDANLYSLSGDGLGDPMGVSVWAYHSDTHMSESYILQSEIANALRSAGFDISTTGEAFIDIDALLSGMTDEFLFSLWPFTDPITGTTFIGDEVWYWQRDIFDVPRFIEHGGHLWDSGWFGENIDALEAAVPAPEPSTIMLLGSGLLGLVVLRIKYRKH